MSKDRDEMDVLFETLGDKLPHSDIYYLKILGDLMIVIQDVLDAFTERQSEVGIEHFKITSIGLLLKVLYGDTIVVDDGDLCSISRALVRIIQGTQTNEEEE